MRQLNHKVENTPTMISLSLGIAAILLFGLGMTFFLEWKSLWYCGIPFALIGIVGMVGNVFLHTKLIVYYKEKYKQEIIELANELLKE